MSDNIKLVIEIPTDLYEITKAKVDKNMTCAPLSVSIAHGKPLPDVLDEIKGEILDYNIRQRVSGSENFLLGYCAGMDKSAEIIDKHIDKADMRGETNE